MAKDKEGFLLYKNTLAIIQKLVKTDNGKERVCDLFFTILEYVNDMKPEPKDEMVDIVFEPIKQHLKRDLKKYTLTIEGRKENGAMGNLKRWNKDLHDKVLKEEMTLQEALFEAEERKTSQNVAGRQNESQGIARRQDEKQVIANVAVLDIDNGIGKVLEKEKIDSRKLKFASTLEVFKETYSREMLLAFYKYWTEPNRSNTKFRQELEKTWDLSRRLETWANNEKIKPAESNTPKLRNYGS